MIFTIHFGMPLFLETPMSRSWICFYQFSWHGWLVLGKVFLMRSYCSCFRLDGFSMNPLKDAVVCPVLLWQNELHKKKEDLDTGIFYHHTKESYRNRGRERKKKRFIQICLFTWCFSFTFVTCFRALGFLFSTQSLIWLHLGIVWTRFVATTTTIPETNSSHLKMDGWNTIVSYWGPAYFQGLC